MSAAYVQACHEVWESDQESRARFVGVDSALGRMMLRSAVEADSAAVRHEVISEQERYTCAVCHEWNIGALFHAHSCFNGQRITLTSTGAA